MENVVLKGLTTSDAKSAADYRRVPCKRMPKWLASACADMVGLRPTLKTKADVWRLVIKCGCMRLERSKDLQRLRGRNLAQNRRATTQRDLEGNLRHGVFHFDRDETYNTTQDHAYCVDRDRDRMESYSDQLHLDGSDVVTIVASVAMATGLNVANNGLVPDYPFDVAMAESDHFFGWVKNRVNGSV